MMEGVSQQVFPLWWKETWLLLGYAIVSQKGGYVVGIALDTAARPSRGPCFYKTWKTWGQHRACGRCAAVERQISLYDTIP